MSTLDSPSERFTIGDMLRAERQRRRLTQQQLADRCGLNQKTVGLIERGHFEPRISTLRRIAQALGVSLDQLVPAELVSSA